jgi:hypothetical protein
MTMNANTNSIGAARRKPFAAVVLFALLVFVGVLPGCSSLVDPQATPPQTITDVRTMYYPFDSTKLTYVYLIHPDPFSMKWDTAFVTMQADSCPNGSPNTYDNLTVYSTFQGGYGQHDPNANMYFALANGEACTLTYDQGHRSFDASWVDLISPLKDSATWHFGLPGQHPGPGNQDSVTATVTRFDVAVGFNGVTYQHVTEVTYVDSSTFDDDHGGHFKSVTKSFKWFAPGLGMIRNVIYDTQQPTQIDYEVRLLKVVSN